jgi:hypothetical protein
MDEGQHFQSVYPPAKAFGGPGRFGFDPAAFMDETHPQATPENAGKLWADWAPHWNTSKEYLIEKSPPNLIRTRFLQRLLPSTSFLIILRHPIAVAYATRKWCDTGIPSLIEHTLLCYESFLRDMPFLHRVYVLRYEEFVAQPADAITDVLAWLGLEPFEFAQSVQPNSNDAYFATWEAERESLFADPSVGFGNPRTFRQFEKRANVFGYSFADLRRPQPISWLGPHSQRPTPDGLAWFTDFSRKRRRNLAKTSPKSAMFIAPPSPTLG